MSSFDINITEVEKQETHDLKYSYLMLNFSGKDVDHVLVNTLRRIMLNNIPTYAIAPECITIEQNTSVFNNDQMRVRLIQLPILNTHVGVDYLPEKYWFNVDYASQEREIHDEEKSIEIYISSKNDDENIRCVTTNDIKYYEDGKEIANKYNQKFPFVLIKLRPREIFVCRMKAVLGTGESSAIWAGVNNASYNYDKTDAGGKAIIKIESQGQMDEYELIWKATKYMQHKLENLKTIISKKYADLPQKDVKDPQSFDITLDEESHTIGQILISHIQERDDIEYAGVGKKNELIKQITMTFRYKKYMKEPLTPIMETIDKIISIMNFMEKKIYKLGNKYITSDVEEKKVNVESEEVKKPKVKKVQKKK